MIGRVVACRMAAPSEHGLILLKGTGNVKIWQPKEHRVTEDEENGAALAEGDPSVTSYDKIKQLYASKNCLTPIQTPDCFVQTESILFNTSAYAARCFTPALLLKGTEEYALWVRLSMRLVTAEFAIKCGIDSLSFGNYRQAFASFEQGARIVKDCLVEGAIDKAASLCEHLLPAIYYAQSRNARDISETFLKQIGGLAVKLGGAMHPLVTIIRHLLVSDLAPEVVCWVERLCISAQGRISARSAHFCLSTHQYPWMDVQSFVLRCEVLGNEYSIQAAEHDYWTMVLNYSITRMGLQHLSLEMARFYRKHGKLVEAEILVSDAPRHLQEFVEMGWKVTYPSTTPLSMMMTVWRLSELAQALAGQLQHDDADTIFQLSISVGLQYYAADNHVVIQAQQAYVRYLTAQNRHAEAKEVDEMIDLGLQMYMLDINA